MAIENANISLRSSMRAGQGVERSEGKPGVGEQHRLAPHAAARNLSREESLRHLSEFFSLVHFCDRASCRRAKTCRGNPERCLFLYVDLVPLAVREFVIGLMNSRELGYSFEEAMRRDKEGVQAFAAWCSVIPGRGPYEEIAR